MPENIKHCIIALILLCAGLTPTVAYADNDTLMQAYAEWKTLRDVEGPLPNFNIAYNFLKNHPGWPQEKLIRARIEAAAMQQHPDDIIKFCTDFPPISGRGMIACAVGGAGDANQRDTWIHQAWRDGDFNDDEEKRILATYGKQFTAAEHLARLDRLLYDEKTAAAKRMLPRVAPQYQLLAEARIALISDAPNAVAKLYNVPKALRNNPGLMLSRIEWRAKRDLDDGVVELFMQAPANPPYADRWWPARASAVRQALREKKYDIALKILERHGELDSENQADAFFLKGWIRMEFKKDLRTAYKDFYALYKAVGTPVSKARAAYWAARAASAHGNYEIAQQWYAMAARHPTVFYGQLAQEARVALAKAHPVPAIQPNPANDKNTKDDAAPEPAPQAPPSNRLELPATPTVSDATRQKIDDNELVQLLPHLNSGEDKQKMLPLFLKRLADQADTAEQAAYIAELATKYAGEAGGVKVAKHALRKQIVLVKAGWPMIDLPDDLGTEPALALAIVRQESEFDRRAKSGADARGYMQLLPGTGKQMAKKLDLRFSPNDLWDGDRNIVLGSNYLGKLIQGFDGSYILAIASYNAGPANVRKWLSREGWPPKDEEGAVNWVESIPYAETRNYVMRVLENLQIYRQQLEPNNALNITHDLTR